MSLQDMQSTNLKRSTQACVHGSISPNSQDAEAAWPSIDARRREEEVVRVHGGILLGQKKEQSLAIRHNTDGPRGHYTE